MPTKLKLTLLCLVTFLLMGCFGSSGGGGSSLDISAVETECHSAQANDCTSSFASHTLYVGWTADTSTDCPSILATVATPDDFISNFDASGTALTDFDSSFLDGRVSSWVNANGAATTSLANGTYLLCSYIDSNSDGSPEPGEPYGELQAPLESVVFLIDQWFEL